MRKILYSLAFAAVLLVSCEEWEPVFTKYEDEPTFKPVEMTPNITIAELKALYQKEGDPVKIDEELIIGGQVVSEDRSGNIYKELYIQDASGAISIKMGQYSMYNDYKPGQWVYVKCSGLTLGSYSGMLQLGFMDPSGDYETACCSLASWTRPEIMRPPTWKKRTSSPRMCSRANWIPRYSRLK